MKEQGESHYTQTSGTLTYFRYHPTPLFPTQEVYGLSVWVCLHQKNLAHIRSGAALEWVIYADDARPTHGHQILLDYTIIHRALSWVEARIQGED